MIHSPTRSAFDLGLCRGLPVLSIQPQPEMAAYVPPLRHPCRFVRLKAPELAEGQFELAHLPASLAATLAVLPSMSLVPVAPLWLILTCARDTLKVKDA